MIVIAQGWKVCSRCKVAKPWEDFHAKERNADGSVRRVQSKCKGCHTERQREITGGKARRQLTPKQRAHLRKRRRQAAMRRLKADPERYAEFLIDHRIRGRLRRERQGAKRQNMTYKTHRGAAVPEAYRARLSEDEFLDPEPFCRWLDEAFPNMNLPTIAQELHVDARTLFSVVNHEWDKVAVTTVDRVFVNYGRPDLLEAIYPLPPKGSS
jgi:hypothetical protein